jgi:alkylation response protein AidB-like acyl-CoA dehydrogenase
MGGVRTNVTYYRDVRVHDRYRLGGVGDGWKVVSGPLASEHGADAPDPLGDLNGPMGAAFTRTLARLVERTVDWAIVPDPATGEPPIDDPLVRSALTAALLDIEVCRSTPPGYGKVAASAALARHAEALLDLTAPAGLLDGGAPGTVEHGVIAWARLFAPATDIYGGTSEMYRNNLARGVLGLPRPR